MQISTGLLLTMGMAGMGSQADVMIWKETPSHFSVMVGEGAAGLSYQMIINAPFTGFAFDMPTYNQKDSSGKLSVFRWAGDCEKTVAGKALHEKVFDNLVDNARNWVEFPALPAGEYLFVISEPKGRLGCWAVTGSGTGGGNMYKDGLPCMDTLQLTIRFAGEAPEKPFGVCAEPIGEIGIAPPQYVPPADSCVKTHDVMPDTWAFVDGLGRKALDMKRLEGRATARRWPCSTGRGISAYAGRSSRRTTRRSWSSFRRRRMTTTIRHGR